MKRLLLTLICFLWGCTTISVQKPYLASDKIKSMHGHELPIIERVSHHTDSTGASLTVTADITNYLREITGTIFLASNIDELSVKVVILDSTRSYDAKDDATTTSETKTIEFEGTESRGCAFAISPDGYFLTAAHVVDEIEGRILFETMDLDTFESSYVVYPYRIVMKDEIADVAIIKTNLVVPFHIDITSVAVPKIGDFIYNGGSPFSSTSYGQIEYVHNMESSYFIKAGAPIVGGDSGSAGVNSKGELLGVATKVRTRKNSRSSVFAMLEPVWISKAIDSDRVNERANKAVDTTAANARFFHIETSKSTNPDVEAMSEAAVVSP